VLFYCPYWQFYSLKPRLLKERKFRSWPDCWENILLYFSCAGILSWLQREEKGYRLPTHRKATRMVAWKMWVQIFPGWACPIGQPSTSVKWRWWWSWGSRSTDSTWYPCSSCMQKFNKWPVLF
jgi:hypothetical protein